MESTAQQATTQPRRVIVTGASTGIGEATVRRAAAAGWHVLATARRQERLKALAEETGCDWVAADLTSEEGPGNVVAKARELGGFTSLVNVCGGAIGTDSVAEGRPEDWRDMYEKNVIATLRLTQEALPELRGGGDVVLVTSTAAHGTYPGGAGYTAAKHAERMIANTMRLELVGEPIRIIEIAPGMVHTPEFSLNRYGGDQEKADAVYAGVKDPLTGADIAEAIMWSLELPAHMNIDSMIIRPVAQASNTVVARDQ